MRKVLIVDDEFEFVNDLAKGLEMFGYEAYKAGDGEGALKVIENKRPDIVLCDYKLPDMNGDTILKKAKENNPGIKFIMVTAYYDEEVAMRFAKLGAERVIFKPIALPEFEKLLKNLLSGE